MRQKPLLESFVGNRKPEQRTVATLEYDRTKPSVVALRGDTLLKGCENLSPHIHTATRSGKWRSVKLRSQVQKFSTKISTAVENTTLLTSSFPRFLLPEASLDSVDFLFGSRSFFLWFLLINPTARESSTRIFHAQEKKKKKFLPRAMTSKPASHAGLKRQRSRTRVEMPTKINLGEKTLSLTEVEGSLDFFRIGYCKRLTENTAAGADRSWAILQAGPLFPQ